MVVQFVVHYEVRQMYTLLLYGVRYIYLEVPILFLLTLFHYLKNLRYLCSLTFYCNSLSRKTLNLNTYVTNIRKH